MATNYNYPYPAPGQIPYPVTVPGLSDREYKRKQIAAAQKRRIGNANSWLSAPARFMWGTQRPLDTVLNGIGLGGATNNKYVGGLVDFIDTANPLAAASRLGDELNQGNFKNAASEVFNVASVFAPATKGFAEGTKQALKLLGVNIAADVAIPNSKESSVPFTKTPLLSGNNVMSPEAVAANRNRTDAQGRSGMGATSAPVRPEFGTFEAPVPVAPGTSIPTVAPRPLPALNPPTPEELGQYGEELTAIDKLYKQTLADIAQEQEQGQLGYARIGQAAQRQAAGSAQDLANQMAGSSIGGSPAAAFGAEQMVQAPLVQQRQVNRLNLDQLLAQLQKQRTQAGTAMDMSKVGLNRWLATQRAANTRSQIESGYQNSLGGM